MSWWLRGRRAPGMSLVIWVVGVLAWAAVGGGPLDVGVPMILRPGSLVPLALWAPLAFVCALCWALEADEGRSPHAVAVRRNATVLAVYCAALLGLMVIALLPTVAAGGVIGLSVMRNVVGLAGLALWLRARVEAAGAAALVAAFVIAASLVGAPSGGGAAWWAWPISSRPTLGSLVAAGACVMLGGFSVLSR